MAKKYRRVVVKVSGEAFSGEDGFGIEPEPLKRLVGELRSAAELDIQIAVVIGAGNLFRGAVVSREGIDKTTADYMGMVATVINGLALQSALEKQGVETRLQTALEMRQLAEPYIRRRAIRHLEKGRLVIFAGGTGSPYFTTDTAAALRAIEIGAQLILKGTKVDGVYSADPKRIRDARRYQRLTFDTVLQKNLAIMDATAIALCRENTIPVVVFNLFGKGNLRQILAGGKLGTIIS
ncbi:MAG TPA: UMP kinase [bacterium]|uniref:Uridylate kinase n=1 Tax=candidate division TA06 bacterium ADurb.Bin417 TaxID=1852828 RepID=A0A1V5MLN1_UNCT6|nr:MAG: Uridylate kinase [candidate division TA06 bacterium ADurb.Bin417]HNQ34610.1 UMP kinase [bacterium]HNS48100.1 UMP kinase [bacterium]